MSDSRLLVPIADTSTIRQTVEYAVRKAVDGHNGHIHFVYVHPAEVTEAELPPATERDRDYNNANTVLERASVWAEEDAGDHAEELTIETSHIGTDEFLFSPEDVGRALINAANADNSGHIIIDPEYDPGIGSPLIRPLQFELQQFDTITFEEAPVRREARRLPLMVQSTPIQIGALFGVSFLFYQLLAGQLYWFDLVTGVMSATIVAVGLSRVTFSQDPGLGSITTVVRHILYVPYLLVEIIKSNVLVAAVILHPRLPIDPRLTRVRPAVWGGLPITTLANSITLTPGTLTVRLQGEQLLIHTLIPAAREDLFDGGLERAVRFVFYGRKAMNIPSPRERGDTEILQDAERDEETTADDAHKSGETV